MIFSKGPEKGKVHSKNDREHLRNSGGFSVESEQTYLMLKCVKVMHRRNISTGPVNKWFILRIASDI